MLVSDINGLRKAAVLMVQLGKERSAAVLSTMREGEVEEITAEIARLESVDAATAQRVMDEFEELVIAHRYYSRGGLAFAREVLEETSLTADAVTFIREHASRRLTVPMVARAVASSSQRLERRFRSVLGRTVQEEIRRAHVEIAKRLLVSSRLGLREVANRSGFTNAALLNVAFQREVGMPPGAYRRRVEAGGAEMEDAE